MHTACQNRCFYLPACKDVCELELEEQAQRDFEANLTIAQARDLQKARDADVD